MKNTAIYNLLKSTVDGLSNVLFADSPSGQPGPWAREDWWITELSAYKQLTEKAPFVCIEVGPTTVTPDSRTKQPFVDLFVPGSPPLLPGDSVGQKKVTEWWAVLQRMVQTPIRPPNSLLEVDYRFLVESRRMKTSDLDNFCVPATQGVSFVALGDVRYAPRIHRIHATKAIAQSNNDLGTQLRIWDIQDGGQ